MFPATKLQQKASIPAHTHLSLLDSIFERLEASDVSLDKTEGNTAIKMVSAPSDDPTVGALRFAPIPGL